MKEQAKICITATDCVDGVLRDINLELNGTWQSLLNLLRIQVESLAGRAGVPVPVLLAVVATMRESNSLSVITMETWAIQEAMKRMGDDKGAT